MNSGSRQRAPFLSRKSILPDLGFDDSEVLEIVVKAELYRGLLQYIKERGFSEQEVGLLLGIHQPNAKDFLCGKVSRFSVSKLLRFASKLDFGVQIKLTGTKLPALPSVLASKGKQKQGVRPHRTSL